MESKSNKSWSDTASYVMPNILQLRLDTSEILGAMQKFLSGELMLPQIQPNGTTKFITQEIGTRLCNKKGVQQLVNFTQGIVNPAVVQGNYTMEQYQNHMSRLHRSLARQILANYNDWEMAYEDLELINDFIMNLVEPFLSRLIDNKERDSYDRTLQASENSRVESGRGFQGLGGHAQ